MNNIKEELPLLKDYTEMFKTNYFFLFRLKQATVSVQRNYTLPVAVTIKVEKVNR